MKQYHGVAAGTVLLAGSLLWGCGNSSVPESQVGSVAGQVTNRGPVSLVRLRQIIPGPVNSPVNSDGSFQFSAPQGLATLEFLDPRQIPYSYAEIYVQPNGTYTLPQPVPGPGPAPSPDPSVNGVSGVLQPGFSGPISPTAPGNLSIRAFGPNGALLPMSATVRLYNPNIQGGPTGSVGQNPSSTNPGLVSGNSAGIAASRSRQASAGDGSSGGTGGSGSSTAGSTGTSTTDTSSTGGAGSNGSTGGASTTAGATAATTGAGTSSSTGSTNGTGTSNGTVTTTSTTSSSGTTSGTTGGPTGSAEQNQLGAQTAPFVNFQNAILATVQTTPAGAVSIFNIPTGAPGLVTPGAVSAFSSSTDAAGNVTLTANAASAASINPTGGGYQLVPLPVTLNGQTLYARQILLDVLPGVTTHVDLLYTPVQ